MVCVFCGHALFHPETQNGLILWAWQRCAGSGKSHHSECFHFHHNWINGSSAIQLEKFPFECILSQRSEQRSNTAHVTLKLMIFQHLFLSSCFLQSKLSKHCVCVSICLLLDDGSCTWEISLFHFPHGRCKRWFSANLKILDNCHLLRSNGHWLQAKANCPKSNLKQQKESFHVDPDLVKHLLILGTPLFSNHFFHPSSVSEQWISECIHWMEPSHQCLLKTFWGCAQLQIWWTISEPKSGLSTSGFLVMQGNGSQNWFADAELPNAKVMSVVFLMISQCGLCKWQFIEFPLFFQCLLCQLCWSHSKLSMSIKCFHFSERMNQKTVHFNIFCDSMHWKNGVAVVFCQKKQSMNDLDLTCALEWKECKFLLCAIQFNGIWSNPLQKFWCHRFACMSPRVFRTRFIQVMQCQFSSNVSW